ncbi:hypothetical protein BDN70DRAFT_121484 [Pholiota conissans]|uniref:Uncharacterized protein n=1 Tax=Pholiota conissans TaxID=109636 RepID=A0A9P6CYU5_9AGAR|nr:hypothetical protein BDN70DRAFT_121484 [Pholiota conissans]
MAWRRRAIHAKVFLYTVLFFRISPLVLYCMYSLVQLECALCMECFLRDGMDCFHFCLHVMCMQFALKCTSTVEEKEERRYKGLTWNERKEQVKKKDAGAMREKGTERTYSVDM